MLSIPLQHVYGLETAASSNKQNFESRYMMAWDNRLENKHWAEQLHPSVG